MKTTVCEYTPDQQKQVENFYHQVCNKNKNRYLVKSVIQQSRRWWSYGIAAIVAHAVTGHSLWSPSSLARHTLAGVWISNKWTTTLVMEVTLWSAGLGIAWYAWLYHMYVARVQERTKRLMNDMECARLTPKGNAWTMTESGRVMGIATLTSYKMEDKKDTNELVEGQIQVTALGSRIELALVQNAIQFARQQGITVITQSHRKNNSNSFF